MCIGAIALIVSQASYSAIITHGNLITDDTTNFITNTITGRKYSRFDSLLALYPNDELIADGLVPSFEGWSIASAGVAYDFIQAMSPQFCSNINLDSLDTCILESTYIDGDFGDSFLTTADRFLYLNNIEDRFSTSYVQIDSGLITIEPVCDIYCLDAVINGPSAYSQTNYLLYKDVIVSESSSLVILGIGLAGLFMRRRIRNPLPIH